jgi:uncharacterized membrane protein
MDLHPIIVHTPVALLTLVALCEFITIIPAVRRSTQFFWVRVFLLMVGFIATFLATMSGDNAWHLHRATVNPYLVHTHEEYASMTQIAFGILAALYLLRIFALDIFTTEHRLGSWVLKLRATRIGDLKARMGRWLARNIWVTIIMALLTRVLTLVMSFTREEILVRMLQILPAVAHDLTQEQRDEIEVFLKERYRQLNVMSLRFLVNVVGLRRYSEANWKKLALNLN